jgi:uncharacterized protein YndB with AHSA1/START domain
MQDIVIRARIPAPRQAVWDLVSDHRALVDWAGAQEVVLRQQGDPPPNGLGAVRVVRARGVAIEEEITAFEPPRRLAYRIAAGLPLRDHSAEILLEPAADGTELVWRARFRPLVPGTGWLLRRLLTRALGDAAARLARHPFQRSAA